MSEPGPATGHPLDVLGDSTNRRILLLASDGPVTAKSAAGELDVTPPTVYRRTDQLVEYDLLNVQWHIDESGNHYRTFETALHRIEVELADGGFTIEVEFRQSLTDSFGGLLTDIEPADGALRLREERSGRPRGDPDYTPS